MYNKLRKNYFERRKFLERLLGLKRRKQRAFFWRSKKKLFLALNWRPMCRLIRKTRLTPKRDELWRYFSLGWWLFLKKLSNISTKKKYILKHKSSLKKKTFLCRKRLARFKRKQRWRMLRFAKYRPNSIYSTSRLRRNRFYMCSKNLVRAGWMQQSIQTKHVNKTFKSKGFLSANIALFWAIDFGAQFFGFLPDHTVRELIFNNRFKASNRYVLPENNAFWPPLFQTFNLKNYINVFLKKMAVIDKLNKRQTNTNRAIIHANFKSIIKSHNIFLGLQLSFIKKYLQDLKKKLYFWRRSGRKRDIFFSSWRYLNSSKIYRNRSKASYALLNQAISSKQEISAFLRTRKRKKKPHSMRKKFNSAARRRLKMRRFHPRILQICDRKFVKRTWLALYKNSTSNFTKLSLDVNMRKLRRVPQNRAKNIITRV